jgi:type I restriction enzyme S subunit
MELTPGYKQTEVRAVPEDWEVEPLGSVGHWFSGGTPSMANDLFWNGEIPWVSAKDMKVARLRDSLLHVTERAIGNGTRLAPAGAVLMVVRGMILAHTLPVAVATRPVAFNQDMKALVVRGGIDSEFILLWLEANAQRILAIASEATHGTKRIPSEDLFSMRIALPRSPEQRAIAGALSDVDALIGALDQLIAKKRDLKQAAMQQLLTGQKRLPGFHGEWEKTTLGQIGECIIGLTYKPENVVEHGLLVLRSSNVQNGQLAYEDNVYVNLEIPEHLVTRPGDILICVRNGSRALIGKCAMIDEAAAGVTFGAFMSVYRTKHSRFIFHTFQAYDIQRQIHENIGATINQITNKDLKAFRVKLPSEDEQTAIAEVLSDMDAELAVLEQRRDKTRALKQGMMQELLTGRIRLVESGKLIEDSSKIETR